MTDQEFFQKCDNLERRIKQLEVAVGKIKADSEPEFEIAQNEKYYFVEFCSRGHNLLVQPEVYEGAPGDKARIDQNNCFKTKERAKEILDKIKLLLKLERLHDIYCPDYKPDWDNPTEDKWRIYYNHNAKKWICGNYSTVSFPPESSFPTRDIAQKVCDVLNKELQ